MLALLALLAPAAAAETTAGSVPAINVQNFRPSIDGTRTLWVDDSSLPERVWMARALFHYAHDPLAYELENGTRVAIVSDVLQADVTAGVRVSRFRLGLDVPLYLTQDGAAGSGAGLGDIGLDGKVSLLDREELPLGLAVDARVSFPTATVDNALGAPNTGWEIAAVVDREVGDKLLVALNVGVRGGPRADLENIDLDDFLVARIAGSYALSDRAGVALEIAGEKALPAPFSNRAGFPIEWLASGYGYATEALVVRGGVGTGLTSGIGAPDVRVALGVGWEPRAKPAPPPIPDTDLDGLTDDVDACPNYPEDVDGFQDADGCLDVDNDADGLTDMFDTCRDEPEDHDGVRDADGCPEPEVRVTIRLTSVEDGAPIELGRTILTGPGGETASGGPERVLELAPGHYEVTGLAANYETDTVSFDVAGPSEVHVALERKLNARIVVTRERIDLQEKVFFDTNKATIQARSFPLLDQVAEVMTDFPEIRMLRVEGHTDSRGNDAYNLDLSRRRAASVREYLVSKGIAPDRLASDGFGETRPLDPAATAAAYEKNRRVDILIERWGESGVADTTTGTPAGTPVEAPARPTGAGAGTPSEPPKPEAP